MMFTIAGVILHSTDLKDKVKSLNEATSEVASDGFSTTDNVLQLLGLCLLLIVILFAAYYTSKFVGKYKLGQFKNSNIQVIEAYRIGTNKMLQIVKIGNRYLLLGIGKDQITHLTELDENEVITHDLHEGEKPSFRQIFEKLKGKKE